ncbi:porin [Roseovarius sp. PS-C2]|uniref:porin n=1 Tax=Roseovarius sp. PS-C2 TaxID=2820814 RepID=UPI001C0C13B5|nr:porin [Roseovarius sp. PS-C2]MBU3259455.1 porin [Roseovarius sp. PS-C2]
MKKQLLCTSAIALGVAAAPAAAQEWNLDWGGYYNVDVLFNSTSGNNIPANVDLDGANIHQNGEIIFTPSVTLDNGLTFGINVQMEALNAGGGADGIDESYMFIEGDTMGRVEVGSENSAGYKLMTGAPGVGFGINSPSPSAFHPTAFSPAGLPGVYGMARNAFGSSYTEVAGNNDTARISYYTPSFNGLTLGVSYAPGNTNAANSGLVNRNVALNDIFDIGVNYSQTFGNVDVELAARWGTGDAGQNLVFVANPGGLPGTAIFTPAVTQPGDPETWGVGARLGVSGWTFGGSYAENDSGLANGVGDTEGWSLGVTYDLAGPWTIGFDTYQGEGTAAAAGFVKATDEYEAYQLGAERELGNGVAWRIYAIQSETSRSVNVPNAFAPGVSKLKVESTTIGTGIRLNF